MTRRGFAFLPFCAALAVAADDINGKWNFVWQTPGGERRSTLSIAVDGDKASVTFPESKSPMVGTFKDGKLTAGGKLYSAEAGQEGHFQMMATLAGSQLKGSASWAEHEMTFTASRADSQGSR